MRAGRSIMADYFTENVSEQVSVTVDGPFYTPVPERGDVSELSDEVKPPEGLHGRPIEAEPGRDKEATLRVTNGSSSFGVPTSLVPAPWQSTGGNQVTTEGLMEEEEGNPKKSTIVGINWPGSKSKSSPDPPQDQRPKCGNCCLKCLKVSTIVSGLCTAVFISFVITTMLLKKHHRQWKPSRTLELLEGDTLLAYQDMLPVQFAATVEKGDSAQFNVSLISVDCQELEIHESILNNSNLSVTFYTDYPIKLPSGYQHYELGSLFIYNISLIDASNISELTMRIFSNTVDAEQYISDYTNQLAQSRSVFYQKFKGNEPSSAVFHPPLASYYIPTFVAPAETTINISYFVSKKYYLFSDYIETYTSQCELNSTETPCYFENSNNTKICVIAHSARTSSTNAARILLTASNTKQWEDHYFSQLIFILSLCFLIGCAVAFVVMFFCCIYKYYKNRPSKPDYMPLESRT